MSGEIKRRSRPSGPVSVTTSASGPISYGESAGAMLIVTGLSGAATLSFWVSGTESSTPYRIYDSSGVAVTVTLANNAAFSMPDACFGAPYVWFSTDAGTCSVVVLEKT